MAQFEIKQINITQLQINTGQIDGLPKNPRFIRDDKFKKLCQSVKDSPEMLNLREIIAVEYKGTLVVIAGNMRLRAAKEIGLNELPVKILPCDIPIEKLREYTIKDNVPFGMHDFESLANEWDEKELVEWGMDIPIFEEEEESNEKEQSPTSKIEITEDNIEKLADLFEELTSRGYNAKLK